MPAQAGIRSNRTPAFAGVTSPNNLVVRFVAADHAELEARTLLDGVHALLQVAHLGVEGVVARLEACVGLVLRFELAVELPHAHPAALAGPERPLQADEQQAERDGEDL